MSKTKNKVIKYFSIDYREETGMYVLMDDESGCEIKTANGNHVIASPNEDLVEFIADDLDRCGKIFIEKDGSIDFNRIPCAYAIFSYQLERIAKEDQSSYDWYTKKAPLYDQCLYSISPGGLEMVAQLERNNIVLQKLSEIIGNEKVALLMSYAEARFYSNNYADEEDWQGPDELISDDEFSCSEVANLIHNLFEPLSGNQKAAIVALYFFTGQKSCITPLLFIRGELSIAAFVKAQKYLGDNLYYHLEESLEKEIFELHKDTEVLASLCFRYGSFTDNPLLDPILDDIKQGETRAREFKSTFFLNNNTNQAGDEIIKSAMKTIVGFQNAHGGRLYLGVKDNGHIIGLEPEVSKLFSDNFDKYQLRIKDKLKTGISSGLAGIDWKLVEIKPNRTILYFDIKKSLSPTYLTINKKEEFYARTGPATELLEGSKLISYVTNHFEPKRS